jgi:Tfp pilus assembly protein PilV
LSIENKNQMFKIINKNSTNKKGFSIGEAILSVFVLGVVMTSVLALYHKSVGEFHDERDSIIASMLAQEGVEVVRNIRDNNWSRRDAANDTTPTAFSGLGSAGSISNNCRVEANSYSVVSNEIIYPSVVCSVASKVLNIDGNGFYTHTAGATPTKFRRIVVLNNSNTDELIVISFVSWNGSNPPTSISACTVENGCVFSQSTLTDWGTGL